MIIPGLALKLTSALCGAGQQQKTVLIVISLGNWIEATELLPAICLREPQTLREGKNLKGHLLGFVLETIGRSVLEKAFVNSIKAN
ncbi:MAG: hypothetical protein WA869_35540 [Alloacidobacterium sp.]